MFRRLTAGFAGKAFALQTQRSEFTLKTQNLGIVAGICNPNTQQQKCRGKIPGLEGQVV